MMKHVVASGIGTNVSPTPQAVAADRSGQVLNRRYRLERCLSRNTLSEIYMASDLLRQQPCSVKLLAKAAAPELHPRSRFQHEAAVLSSLSHPSIIAVREFNKDASGEPFLVMEPLWGQTLQDLLTEQGKLPLLRTLSILIEVGRALAHVHNLGFIHGDLKPSSIFLAAAQSPSQPGERGETVKLLDFELSRVLGKEGLHSAAQSAPGLIVGTPAYMAPEALTAEEVEVDARLDQWSLGVIAYRSLTGHLPFHHDDPCVLGAMIRVREPAPLEHWIPDLPEHVLCAIRTAMSKDKEQRYAKIQDFTAALENPLPPTRSRGMGIQTLKSIRVDLIAMCRREPGPDDAVPVPIYDETTLPYPVDSFAHRLMAPKESPIKTGQLPVIHRPPWHLYRIAGIGMLVLATLGAVGTQRAASMQSTRSLLPPAQERALSESKPAPLEAEPVTALSAESVLTPVVEKPLRPQAPPVKVAVPAAKKLREDKALFATPQPLHRPATSTIQRLPPPSPEPALPTAEPAVSEPPVNRIEIMD